MKFTIKKDLMVDALVKVSKAISTKNLIPVLSGIKMELNKKRLLLTASDNDITIQVEIPKGNDEDFSIEKEGSIIVQGKYILDIVRKLPSKLINIEVIDGFKIRIYTENSEFNLNGIVESEFPNIMLEESKDKIEITNEDLKQIVMQTSFASSHEETKPILTGINFNFVGNILECNSTDSYRLARKIVKLNKELNENFNIVVPSHNLEELFKILDDNNEMIEIHIFSNKVLFKNKNLKFQSRIINGTYPNTTNLLPKDYFFNINVDLDQFYSVVDRASILMSDKEKNIVTLETDGNELYIRSHAAEIGKVEEKMEINNDSGKNIKISFSAKYMMEALKAFSTKTVEINFVGEIKPIIIKSLDDESLTQLVLPIRTY